MNQKGSPFGMLGDAIEFDRFADGVTAGSDNAETIETVDLGSDIGDISGSSEHRIEFQDFT